MRSGRMSLLVLLANSCVLSAVGQGAFQNLNFESANVPSLPPDQVAILPLTNVFPGWTGYSGTSLVTQVYYNGYSLGSALITLINSNTADVGQNVIEGKYTATLSAGVDLTTIQGIVPSALAQTGTIPTNTESLRFSATPLWPGSISNLVITFAGHNLAFFPLANRGNSVEYGVDISAFAGQSGELRFSEQPITRNDATIVLDKILFSSIPVPEPSTTAFLVLGLFLSARRLSILH